MIRFKRTDDESALIDQIVERAAEYAAQNDVTFDRLASSMDLAAVNANGCPLDFQKLLDFPIGDFGHDVFGIRRYLDRNTGKLTEFFLPRCAK